MMAGRWSQRLPITGGDKILIGILLLLSLASFYFLRFFIPHGTVAVVEVDGRPICRLDLSIDTQRTVQGPLGETVIQVHGGQVRVVDSPCPHKLCVRTGWIDQAGRMIVCVPNRVVVRVEGEAEVDAVSW
jgi:hypothetical protein